MNHDRLNKFTKIEAQLCACMEILFKSQYALAELMCECCGVPIESKDRLIDELIENMNRSIGIKIERLPS